MVKKGLERAARRKAWYDYLCAFIWQIFASGFAALLSSGPALLSRLLVSIMSSCPRLPTLLSSCPLVLALLSHFRLPTLLLSCLSIPTWLFCSRVPTLSSLLLPTLLSHSMLGLAPTWFTSSTLRTFKQALSDESLDRQSTSPSPPEPLCLFSILGLLLKKAIASDFLIRHS